MNAPFAGAGIAMIGYVLVAARRVSSRGVGARATAIACTILGIAGFFAAQSGTTFSVWLDERGGLPRIVHEATPWMHAGETLVLRPRLEQGNASGWTPPPPIRLSPERPGRLRLQAAANLGPLRIERRWSIRAREALSHPSLPLQVGNRWRYQWTRTSHGALVWGLVRTRGPSSQGRFELAITESRVQRGARQFRISRFDETREPESWWLYPLEGRTFVLSGEVPAAADRALDMPWPGSDEAFSIPMIPGACRGVARGPLPGPCVCDRRGGVDVGSVVVAVFTAGLVLPQSDERTV
ncbi:MAG: hypothetical protein HUU23_16760, partial [Caldilineales bacterium]|nr:hypothetical protein [Caldilineales bacterium]